MNGNRISTANLVLLFSVFVLVVVVAVPVILIFITAFFEDGKVQSRGL